MTGPFAIFLTVFGLGGLPIAIGFTLATRGAAPRPWLAPWRAGYCSFAAGFLLLPMAAQEATQATVLPIGHGLFLLGTGLNTLGWLRLWRGPMPLALAALPTGLYGLAYLTWARYGSLPRWAGTFSVLYTLTTAVAAVAAHRGLGASRSPQRVPTVLLLTFQSLFWMARSFHTLVGFPGMGFIASLSAVMVEGTVYLGLLAYLQWSVVME